MPCRGFALQAAEITWPLVSHIHGPSAPNHTFFAARERQFSLRATQVDIKGAVKSARADRTHETLTRRRDYPAQQTPQSPSSGGNEPFAHEFHYRLSTQVRNNLGTASKKAAQAAAKPKAAGRSQAKARAITRLRAAAWCHVG